MKFAVGLTPLSRYPGLASLQETVRTAERLGYDAVSIGDHAVIPSSHRKVLSPFWYDSLVLGTAVAVSTERLRLLFNTLVLPCHNPVRLAKSLATLDVLSGGRIEVGIGVGWIPDEFSALGVQFQERGAVTDEYLRAMKELWTSDDPRFEGKYVSFADIAFEPKPLQRPGPPIWIGGGVRRTLHRAAELGDGWHPLGRSWEQLNSDVAELRELVAARGRRPEEVAMGYTLYFDSVAGQTVRHTRQAGGGEATVLKGDPDEAIGQIEQFAALGFTRLTMRFRGLSHTELCAAMESFQSRVMAPYAAGTGDS